MNREEGNASFNNVLNTSYLKIYVAATSLAAKNILICRNPDRVIHITAFVKTNCDALPGKF